MIQFALSSNVVLAACLIQGKLCKKRAQSAAKTSVLICQMRFTQVVLGVFVLVESCAGGRQHLCGEVILALQTSSKQKPLWSAESEEAGGGGREEGGVGAALPFHREVPGGQHGAQLQSNRDVSSGSCAAPGKPISPRLSVVPPLLFTRTSPQQRAQRRERRHLLCFLFFFLVSKRE